MLQRFDEYCDHDSAQHPVIFMPPRHTLTTLPQKCNKNRISTCARIPCHSYFCERSGIWGDAWSIIGNGFMPRCQRRSISTKEKHSSPSGQTIEAARFIEILESIMQAKRTSPTAMHHREKRHILREVCERYTHEVPVFVNLEEAPQQSTEEQQPAQDADDEATDSLNGTNQSLPPPPRLIFTGPQRRALYSLLNISNPATRKVIMAYINYTLSSGPSGHLTSQKKQRLEEWLRQHNYRAPNSRELYWLQHELELNKDQIRTQVLLMLNPSSSITEEQQKFMRDWFQTHGYKPLNAKDRKEIGEKTGLQYRQIYDYGRRFAQKPGRVTPEAKQIVREWVAENGSQRMPTDEEFDVLMHLTRLNKEQLRYQLRQMRGGWSSTHPVPVTREGREYVQQWLKENDNRSPTNAEREEIARKTNLSRRQLTNILYYSRMNHGVVTRDVRDAVLKWCKENTFEKPTGEQVEFLLQMTGLSRLQLMGLLRRLRDKEMKGHEAS